MCWKSGWTEIFPPELQAHFLCDKLSTVTHSSIQSGETAIENVLCTKLAVWSLSDVNVTDPVGTESVHGCSCLTWDSSTVVLREENLSHLALNQKLDWDGGNTPIELWVSTLLFISEMRDILGGFWEDDGKICYGSKNICIQLQRFLFLAYLKV
jgi:hypothetical protein